MQPEGLHVGGSGCDLGGLGNSYGPGAGLGCKSPLLALSGHMATSYCGHLHVPAKVHSWAEGSPARRQEVKKTARL